MVVIHGGITTIVKYLQWRTDLGMQKVLLLLNHSTFRYNNG